MKAPGSIKRGIENVSPRTFTVFFKSYQLIDVDVTNVWWHNRKIIFWPGGRGSDVHCFTIDLQWRIASRISLKSNLYYVAF
jgi:hypothetical protein